MKHHTFFYFFNYDFLQFFFLNIFIMATLKSLLNLIIWLLSQAIYVFFLYFFSPMHGYAFLLLYVSYFCCWKLGILDIIL